MNNILSSEQRISLRDELFEGLKDIGLIIYTERSKTYRLSNLKTLKQTISHHPHISNQYDLYINQFRSEREAVYCLTHKDDINNHLCPVCNNPNLFYVNKTHIRYQHTCGNIHCIEMLANSKDSKTKSKRTCLEKYGVDHQLKSKVIMDKVKQTNLERRGVEYSVLDPAVKELSKQTNLENIGYANPFSSPIIQDQIKQTNLERYGVENPMQNDDIVNKAAKTYAINHGPKNPIVDNDTITVINILKTNLSNQNLTRADIYGNKEYFKYFIKEFYKYKQRKLRLYEIANVFEKESNTIKHKVANCNLLEYFFIKDSNLELKFLSFLNDNGFKENEDFLRHKFNLDTTSNTKQQTDFILPNHNIGFEINDIDSHNIKHRDHDYHYNKTLLSQSKGIRLIHIWEWELIDDILWNRLSKWILNLLNTNRNMIGASKCKCKLVPQNDEKLFLDTYHLQGYIKSELCYGLYYNNELIQLMSFIKSRYNKNYEWELLRLCTKYDYLVKMGSIRLLNHFIKHHKPKSIISYCNLDKFDGSIYKKLGFTLLRRTQPSAIWYNEETENRFLDSSLFKKGADKLLGTNFGKGTSNEEIAMKSGYQKIYNCGQNVYTMIINNSK